MKRCTKCIFPESIPKIKFNKNGICNYCQTYKPINYLGEEKLIEKINIAKTKNKKYDCIVPISGGRDSCYVLYLAKKKFGLNTLAVNYDNEFRHQQALINMKKACKILNTDLFLFRSKKNIATRIVSSRIKNSLNNPFNNKLRILSGSFCVACTYGYKAIVYQMAKKYDVPLILWGNSQIEKTDHMTMPVLGGGIFDKFSTTIFLINSEYLRLLQRLEFPFSEIFFENLFKHRPKLRNSNSVEISIYDYIKWDRKKIKSIIMSELDWKKPESAISTWRTDCKLDMLVNYCFFNIFGCSKSCFGFHNMINENQMTREEALEVEEKTIKTFTNDLEELLINIGLSKREINKIKSFSK